MQRTTIGTGPPSCRDRYIRVQLGASPDLRCQPALCFAFQALPATHTSLNSAMYTKVDPARLTRDSATAQASELLSPPREGEGRAPKTRQVRGAKTADRRIDLRRRATFLYSSGNYMKRRRVKQRRERGSGADYSKPECAGME